MNTKVTVFLPFVICALAAVNAFTAEVPVAIESIRTNGQNQTHLAWPAEADRDYDVATSTNLNAGSWSLATNSRVSPTNLIGEFRHLSTTRTQFYRVVARDTRGPDITYRSPATNGAGVGRFAALTVNLTDESGVDTNRFALTRNGLTLTNGSPGVSVTTNSFQYAPGTNAWGDYGSTCTVGFICADLRGNTTTSSWSFTLEVLPVVTNILIHLPPPVGLKSSAMARAAQLHGANFTEGLSILTFETNLIVFSYPGATNGLFLDGILVSHDPARHFYRQITNLVDDVTNHAVTAYTVDVPLTALVKEGSFSAESFVVTTGAKTALWTANLGYSLPFSYTSEFTVQQFDVGDHVRVTPGNLTVDLSGKVDISGVIKDWKVQQFDAAISSDLAAELRAKVEFLANADLIDWSSRIGSPILLARAGGFIGPVPVWAYLQLEVDLGLEASAEGAVVIETGLDAYANSDFRLAWSPAGSDKSYNGNFHIAQVPLEMKSELTADAFLYLKPRLSAIVESLAGVYADYRRGPDIEASYTIGDPQCAITLYDDWSIKAGLTVLGVKDSDLPNVTLLQEKQTVQTWYWPEIPEKAPVFTTHPSSLTVAAGSTVTLQASASGSPTPTYQWFQNGIGIPFKTAPTLSFTMGANAAGTYTVIAKNRVGWVISNPATVSLQTPPPPSVAGMVWIAPGTFLMGSSNSELHGGAGYGETPHTVMLSHGFYMSKYLVTQAEYQAVVGSNPSYFKGATTLPVENVTWYDATEYCRALTQQEWAAGRLPAGWVFRLPTESEWEYACRAGTTTVFYFGSAIHGGMANFCSGLEYDAAIGNIDISNPVGYVGRTTPVGSYAPNPWGLYDMCGNVCEWCQDWYDDYPTGSVTDPTGPGSGSYRVLRGAGWNNIGWCCRSAYRGTYAPDTRSYSFGFRPVLAPVQP